MPIPPSDSRRPSPRSADRSRAAHAGRERRRHPRATADLPITISLAQGSFEARLRDLSASGVCFFLDRPVPEMTILRFRLPIPSGGSTREVDASGAVVRCRRISPAMDHYEVAVFLHDIRESDRELLASWVEARGG